MTPEQMDRIDRLLAKRLMGWVWSEEHNIWVLDSERDADGRLTFCCPDSLDYDEEKGEQEFWSSTSNIAQALGDGGPGTVVGEMRKRGFTIDLFQLLNADRFTCRFFDNNNPDASSYWKEGIIPALAICLAATAMLGIDLEEKDD